MKTDINLAIRHKVTSRLLSASQIKKLRLGAIILLFTVGVLSVGLFLTIAASPLTSLRQQEQDAGNTLKRYQSQFGKQLLVRSQLESIQSLLAARPNLGRSIDTILAIIPPGVQVSTVAISEKEISMNATASTLDQINVLFTAILEKVAAKEVPSTVTTSGIAYSTVTGEYSLQITFE